VRKSVLCQQAFTAVRLSRDHPVVESRTPRPVPFVRARETHRSLPSPRRWLLEWPDGPTPSKGRPFAASRLAWALRRQWR